MRLRHKKGAIYEDTYEASGGGSSIPTTEGQYTDEIIGTVNVGGTTYTKHRRIVHCGNCTTSSSPYTKETDTGLTINDIHKILSINVITGDLASGNTYTLSLPFVWGSGNCAAEIGNINSQLKVVISATGTLAGYKNTIATIEYY